MLGHCRHVSLNLDVEPYLNYSISRAEVDPRTEMDPSTITIRQACTVRHKTQRTVRLSFGGPLTTVLKFPPKNPLHRTVSSCRKLDKRLHFVMSLKT